MLEFLKDTKILAEVILIFLPVILLIWYIIGSIKSGGTVIKSRTSKKADDEKADLIYYLPTAALQIKATAGVIITRSILDNAVVDTKLVSLQLENTVLIQPDTEHLFLANYIPSIFANDEIRVSTTPQGLLENIMVTTEDRISNIIGQITELPQKLLFREVAAPESLLKKEVIVTDTIDQLVEYTRTFVIPSSGLKNSPFEISWDIIPEGIGGAKHPVDAAIQFTLPEPVASSYTYTRGEYDGLVTRPQRKFTLDVKTKPKNSKDFSPTTLFSYELFIPDPSRIVVVPIKRAAFVKSQHAPKFNAGMLLENFISKPSEVEGAISIPINILKAIFSIPAQLLSFKITRLKQESDLEAIQQKLAEQRTAALKPPPPQEKPAPNPAPGTNALQQQLMDRRNRDDAAPANLGKLPADETSTAQKLQERQSFLKVMEAAGISAFATPPSISMWQAKVNGDWNSYSNETIPNCVPAAGAHLVMSWSANAQSQMRTPSFGDVQKAYNAVAEGEGGCRARKFLERWVFPGAFGNKISSYVAIHPKDIDEVKIAVHYFGGCLAGLQLPSIAKNKDKWERPNGDLTGDAKPGSWCGHAVAILGYYENYFIIVSLGQLVTMSWEFYKAYNDETFVILNKSDWIIPESGQSPQGLAFNTLQDGIGSLQA